MKCNKKKSLRKLYEINAELIVFFNFIYGDKSNRVYYRNFQTLYVISILTTFSYILKQKLFKNRDVGSCLEPW